MFSTEIELHKFSSCPPSTLCKYVSSNITFRLFKLLFSFNKCCYTTIHTHKYISMCMQKFVNATYQGFCLFACFCISIYMISGQSHFFIGQPNWSCFCKRLIFLLQVAISCPNFSIQLWVLTTVSQLHVNISIDIVTVPDLFLHPFLGDRVSLNNP